MVSDEGPSGRTAKMKFTPFHVFHVPLPSPYLILSFSLSFFLFFSFDSIRHFPRIRLTRNFGDRGFGLRKLILNISNVEATRRIVQKNDKDETY